ncbi:hypothetical protein [Niallia sp. Krafla_26]|uniref:hypothetical protein n=1 Tax=Niallia sp. Krafla_26 TaxID=3064703 RepID=UPI003D162E87
MSKNKKIKSISFNFNNNSDMEILKKIDAPNFNFSGYVKKLILEDIRKEQMRALKSSNGGIKIVLK